MDTLTHALSGALIGRATAARTPGPDTLPLGRRMFAGFVAAAFPDIDVVASYLSPLSYLYHHRGMTHSILLVPLWAMLLAVVFAALWRHRPPWRAYLGIAAIGIVSHIAGDLITNFGTMIFAPFSDARFALSSTFIIDLWFTGIILAGLLGCIVWRTSRAPAIAGVAALIAYVGLQLVIQQRMVDFGAQYVRAQRLEGAVVTAMPRPVSPFNWTVIVAEGSGLHYAHVNLIRKTARPAPDATTAFLARLDAPYRPLADARWVRMERYGSTPDERALAREAFRQPGFRFFRWFAAYPTLLHVERNGGEACAWFHDLRFVTPGRDGTPFQYGMCRGEGTGWRAYQLVGDQRKAVY